MRLVITPRDGSTPLEFFCPDGGGYVRLEGPGRTGTLGWQLCYGGGFTGGTVTASDASDFGRECRRWYKARKRAEAA